jgi:hypothetical protein
MKDRTSSYLDHLPAIYRPDPRDPQQVLGNFLLAFEHILSGSGSPDAPGIEELLAGIEPPGGPPLLRGIQRYFDPGAANDRHTADADGTTHADRSFDT